MSATWPAPPPRSESLAARWLRRVATIAGVQVAAWGATFALILLPLEVVLDLLRGRPLGLARTHLLFVVYAWAELVGVACAGALWLWPTSADRFRAANARLQRAWVVLLLRAATRLFALRFEAEVLTERAEGATPITVTTTTTLSSGSSSETRSRGPVGASSSTGAAQDVLDLRALLAGPVLVLARHVSPVDTLLPIALLGWPIGPRLRYVMKHALLLDPCLDVVGQRLPNVFVRRGAAREAGPSREVLAVGQLGAGLGPEDGVLIYPEGTRFTEGKRAQVLSAIDRSGDAAALVRATQLARVLPARTGGVLALLDAAPDADALFLAHVGLEPAGSFRALVDGRLVGRTIRLGLWRVARAAIPGDPEGRAAWLHAEWRKVDAWVAAHEEAAP